jgi:plasmid stability protein
MTLTIDLPEDEISRLNARAGAAGVTAEQCARQILKEALEAASGRPPLAARIREIWAGMPDDIRSKLPADSASEHDHYIYGKRKPYRLPPAH